MIKIYKYAIKGMRLHSIEMPAGSIIRHLALQNDQPHIWVEVDIDKEPVQRLFFVAGTGHLLPEHPDYQNNYIGTYQQGAFVWHVYESVPVIKENNNES
jgi:hypothetical protein